MISDNDLNVDELRRQMGDPTRQGKGGDAGLFKQRDLSGRNKGKRGIQLLMGLGAVFGILFAVILFSPAPVRRTGSSAASSPGGIPAGHPASSAVDGVSSSDAVSTPQPAASGDAVTSALDAEMAGAPKYSGKYAGTGGTQTSSNAGSTIGGSVVPGQGGAHPASASAPPLTPAQIRAIARAQALAQARSGSLSMLNEGASPSAEPSAAASPNPSVQGQGGPDVMSGEIPPVTSGLQIGSNGLPIVQGGGAMPTAPPVPQVTPNGDAIVMKTHRYRAPSPFVLDAGTMIPIVLDHPINTDADGPLVGHVAEDIKVNGQTVIPFWTEVFGATKALTDPAGSRIPSMISYFIFPDHSYMPLSEVIGTDSDGTPGFTPTSVNDHRGRVFGAAGITSVLSAIPIMLAGGPASSGQSMSAAQNFALMVGENTSNAGSEIVQKRANATNTLIADAAHVYGITLEQSIPFTTPYRPLPPRSGVQ